jgi:hypothetical protein
MLVEFDGNDVPGSEGTASIRQHSDAVALQLDLFALKSLLQIWCSYGTKSRFQTCVHTNVRRVDDEE